MIKNSSLQYKEAALIRTTSFFSIISLGCCSLKVFMNQPAYHKKPGTIQPEFSVFLPEK